ncbi:MBL fold metallo-hydrolase [Marinigracilibium pacificum]|uniref:MBL fold metallo-hydrolase n=1 Tax=Marinigracilibium pacificum TaxID=2729599 RepID=A0A848J2A3_9BACT|nr:MBL fold metallo-hydrolase [Marinigracilibium pacificum]NMM49851.1 MBL fold metallo-hydrolase [Marinigracilibium pacificum]
MENKNQLIEQIYTGCLAQGAYYIESNGEAAVIDPLRDVDSYIKKAESRGAKIKYIFETHFHADFVSGHLDLAKKTGAPIIFGPNAKPSFDAIIAEDGQSFKVGDLEIKVLHTPGHTMESSCFLLEENGTPKSVFTGDTLFIGDVGRPDLAQKVGELTMEDLAGYLFESLRNKIMTLPNDVIVYPGHGAGSACGKNMSKETVSTIGEQKESNYALRADMTKDEFIKEVTDGLTTPPAYFPMNVKMNKEGYENIDEVVNHGMKSLTPDEFEAVATASGALILDTRAPQDFAKGFIPNSINIGLDGQFAPWVGALIPIDQEILIVAEVGREEEAVTRLARVGYDKALGHLKGGFESWKNSTHETDHIPSISAEEFATKLKNNKDEVVVDVRRSSEYQSEHVVDAMNIELDYINEHMAEFPKDKHFFVHCKGGYRSMIASSILKSRGFENFTDVAGGFDAIAQQDVPKTDYVCPSTL